ncbi:MAG: aspartate--tRNA(Asn) ligase [Mycoplasmoidaceae bacterium]|nr:MAG: aspartate--tRNA(Asn) ligase [Mycoplasmoidaceae bacterium]
MITSIDKLKLNKIQTIQGFVENIRNKPNICFLVIKDVTSKIQVTVVKEKQPQFNELLDKITNQTVLTIKGKMIKNEGVKLNGVEIIPESIEIETISASPLPLDDTSLLDQRIDFRWLDLRSEKNQLLFKVQTYMTHVMKEFLFKQNFIEIHTPSLIGTASESGSEVFEISNYFGKKAYLAQSPQFYKQLAICGGLEKVVVVGPVFRAENSRTTKHATEFTGFDLEFSGVDSCKDVMNLEEKMLVYMLKKVKTKYGKEIERLFNKPVIIPSSKFPSMRLEDVYKELKQKYNYEVPLQDQGDINAEGEKFVEKLAMDKYKSEFMFITGYSKETRPFYHARDQKGEPQGYDLIWRGVEITSGAKRENRYDVLKKQAEEKGLGKDVQFYLDFFKYGCAPHGGFGIGLDRLTMLLLGISIKEVQFVCRNPDRLIP